MEKVKVAVLASGRGSNFLSILDEIKAGNCNAEIKLLVTNNPEAPAINIAKENDIAVERLEKKNF
jgi:phosphoribosylglycinamide formyltransferase-1